MSDALLTRCPVCGYSFERLPDRHRCPECGYKYDKHGQVITQVKQTGVFLLVLGGRRAVNDASWFALALSIVGTVGLATLLSVVFLGKRNKVILLLGGLVIVGLDGHQEEIGWDQIDAVVEKSGGTVAKLYAKDGKTIRSLDEEFLGSRKNILEFIAAENKLKQRCAEQNRRIT